MTTTLLSSHHMALAENVVVDTSAFYALVSETDEFHASATSIFEDIMDRDQSLWTTSYALIETIALVHRRLGFDTLSQTLTLIESRVQIYWIGDPLHSMALQEFVAAGGSGLSLVDRTVVMLARMKSAQVFTFDSGMANIGVPIAAPR